MFSAIKRLVPRSVKSAIKGYVNAALFYRCVKKLSPSVIPSERQLKQLGQAWGNDWSAGVTYLRAVCEAARSADAPILECGSGLTTVLLAIYAGKRGIPTLSLEHHSGWRSKIQETLRRFNLPGEVAFCPLKEYNGFDWYTLPPSILTGFCLVICDGPPGGTRGNRVGLVPVCKQFLLPNCIVLLDDAERTEEQSALEQWAQTGARVQILPGMDGTYAQVVVP